MLDNQEKFVSRIDAKFYSDDEKRVFIYNCTMNTIDEFIDLENKFMESYIGIGRLNQMFEQNLRLKHFEYNQIEQKLSKKTYDLINEYRFLRINLTSKGKNNVMARASSILAGT